MSTASPAITRPLLILSLATALFYVGCQQGSGPPASVPESHTSNQDGIWHAPLSGTAQDDCGGCHGIEESVADAVSCIDCHDAASISNGSFGDD